ncbi:hypothetical protein [Clostridium massiliamazoniense]|uniref:hypothetical protein n=1 Tax=Clostridium massiliamazoniense TaxID=1347366 RepID=UPI0006D84C42|nr:hypothetical protein [Clostridium massiliamazoniense]
MKNIRLEILNFLQWNDEEGNYSDERQIALGNKPFTLQESKILLWHTLFIDIIKEFEVINPLKVSYEIVEDLVYSNNLKKLSDAILNELAEGKNDEESYYEILKAVAHEISQKRKFYFLLKGLLNQSEM